MMRVFPQTRNVTKRVFSLLLAVILAVGTAFACTAKENEADVNADLLEWVKTDDSQLLCTLFILQNDALYAMQPDTSFTVYGKAQDTEQLTEQVSGSTTQWTRSDFTDADGNKRVAWTLSDMPFDAYCLQFAAGAFTDKSGNPAPEMCAAFKARVNTYFSYHCSADLSKLQTVKTDADLVEGEMLSCPQDSVHMPASLFSVLAKTDSGESTIAPAYDDRNSLVVPVSVGDVQYTLLFCGRPIAQTKTISTLPRADYEAMYKKDRTQSIWKGLALIPCLPVYVLLGGFEGAATAFAVSMVFVPVFFMLPFTGTVFFVKGLGQGAVNWWQTVRDLIGGKS